MRGGGVGCGGVEGQRDKKRKREFPADSLQNAEPVAGGRSGGQRSPRRSREPEIMT